MSDERHNLTLEIDAARVLRERYREALGDDAEAIADTIEGATSLFEQIEAMLCSIDEDKILVDGIKNRQGELSDRRSRIEKRIETKRTLILTAMQIAEVRGREFPSATISRSRAPDMPIITEEADVPARFFEQPKPVLSKSAVNAYYRDRFKALKEAEKIRDAEARIAAIRKVDETLPELPGVTVSNGGETLTISPR